MKTLLFISVLLLAVVAGIASVDADMRREVHTSSAVVIGVLVKVNTEAYVHEWDFETVDGVSGTTRSVWGSGFVKVERVLWGHERRDMVPVSWMRREDIFYKDQDDTVEIGRSFKEGDEGLWFIDKVRGAFGRQGFRYMPTDSFPSLDAYLDKIMNPPLPDDLG